MAEGKVLRVIGPVVDCEFPAEQLPEIMTMLFSNEIAKRTLLKPAGHENQHCQTGTEHAGELVNAEDRAVPGRRQRH